MMRLFLGAVLAALMFAVWLFAHPAQPAGAQGVAWSVEDTFDALDAVSASTGVSWQRLYLIVRCETSGTFNPYSVGRQRELGVAQLHPRGELPRFYAWGYTDPFSPHQAVEFLAIRLQQGGARAWTCARLAAW